MLYSYKMPDGSSKVATVLVRHCCNDVPIIRGHLHIVTEFFLLLLGPLSQGSWSPPKSWKAPASVGWLIGCNHCTSGPCHSSSELFPFPSITLSSQTQTLFPPLGHWFFLCSFPLQYTHWSLASGGRAPLACLMELPWVLFQENGGCVGPFLFCVINFEGNVY